MDAKLAFVVGALMLTTMGLSVAEIPNLMGNWTGTFEGYVKSTGYTTGNITMVISEQKDRLFTGVLILNFSAAQKDQKSMKSLSGVIGLDNKTLYMAEYDKGYDIGTVLSNDTIELDYLADGETAGAFMDTIHRVK